MQAKCFQDSGCSALVAEDGAAEILKDAQRQQQWQTVAGNFTATGGSAPRIKSTELVETATLEEKVHVAGQKSVKHDITMGRNTLENPDIDSLFLTVWWAGLNKMQKFSWIPWGTLFQKFSADVCGGLWILTADDANNSTVSMKEDKLRDTFNIWHAVPHHDWRRNAQFECFSPSFCNFASLIPTQQC